MTPPPVSRIVAAAALVLVLAACAAPAVDQGVTDTVGADHAVRVPVVDPESPAPSDVVDPESPAPSDVVDPESPAPSDEDVPDCSTVAPADASPAALAYLAAIDASTPAWVAIDYKIHAAGDTIYFEDLGSQIAADATFLSDLKSIEFPPSASGAASDLIAAVQAYDDFLSATLQAGDFGDDYADVDGHLLAERARSSSRLRDTLDVPQSDCLLRRP